MNSLSSRLTLLGLIGILGGGAGMIISQKLTLGAPAVFGFLTLAILGLSSILLGEYIWKNIKRFGVAEERLWFGGNEPD